MPSPEAAASCRILVVEDDNANRYAIAHMLASFGLEVVEAATAPDAIRSLGDKPTHLLLDWLIPGGGDSVLRHVRKNSLPTRVVVVTVAYEERQAEIHKLKPDVLLRKPFKAADVLAALKITPRTE